MQSPSHSSMAILPRLEAIMDAGSVFLPCAFSPYRCRDGDFSECGLFTVGIRSWLLIWLDQLVCESGMAGDTKFLLWLLLLNSSSLCFGSELDIQCLKSVQKSVIDPSGVLNFRYTKISD